MTLSADCCVFGRLRRLSPAVSYSLTVDQWSHSFEFFGIFGKIHRSINFFTDLTCFMFLLSPTTFCCVVWHASTVWRQSPRKITRFTQRASTLPQMTRNTRLRDARVHYHIRFAQCVLFITRVVHETCFCCRSCNGSFFFYIYRQNFWKIFLFSVYFPT